MSTTATKFPLGATLQPTPFEINIPESSIEGLKTLLRLSRLPPKTFENQSASDLGKFGVGMDWMKSMKEEWEQWDWKTREKQLNEFENYKVKVRSDGLEHEIHFAALISERQDAVPIVFLHGWPGAYLEFLPLLSLLKSKYTAKTLPYTIIVPSLPGYGFSSPPPLDRDFGIDEVAKVIDGLMVGLGLKGYFAQGGDVGASVAQVLGAKFKLNCRGVHRKLFDRFRGLLLLTSFALSQTSSVNYATISNSKADDLLKSSRAVSSFLTSEEQAGLDRFAEFRKTGSAYATMHMTRPSTIGFVLASNPLALLAWIGEKFLAWPDQNKLLEKDTILTFLSLYWYTETFPTSVYPYRQLVSGQYCSDRLDWHMKVPLGFSSFPQELGVLPKKWIETFTDPGETVFYKKHTSGGHFAALEKTEELLKDVIEFVEIVKAR